MICSSLLSVKLLMCIMYANANEIVFWKISVIIYILKMHSIRDLLKDNLWQPDAKDSDAQNADISQESIWTILQRDSYQSHKIPQGAMLTNTTEFWTNKVQDWSPGKFKTKISMLRIWKSPFRKISPIIGLMHFETTFIFFNIGTSQ